MIFNRNVVDRSEKYLDTEEVLIFTGARQAGKTTILKKLQSVLENRGDKTYFINLEDPDYLKILDNSPKGLFKIVSINDNQKIFIFVDEVQYLKNPTNFIKYIFDEYKGKIKLIVSGSSAFYLDKKFEDSLAGRKKIFNVNTLSFREFLKFKSEDEYGLKDFTKLALSEKEYLSTFFEEYCLYGGYPKVVLQASPEEKIEELREIAYSYIKKDIYEANIRQDEVFYRLLKILSMQVGNLVNSSELSSTLNISKTAIDNYLYVMEKSFHIARILPLFRNLRKELTKMPKVQFMDLGLRNFFANNFEHFELRGDKGMFFENIVYRLLMDKYGSDKIKYWRTQDKKEVDFVLEDEKIAFEAKSKFRKNEFKKFKEYYPEIDIKIVSFETILEMIG